MHIMNQSGFFALRLNANNRLNTVYMVSYFIEGLQALFAGAQAWKYYQCCQVQVVAGASLLFAHITGAFVLFVPRN